MSSQLSHEKESSDNHTAVTINHRYDDVLQNSDQLECLSWTNLSYTIRKKRKDKTIISQMYGSVQAGEVIAIMGASGAGKSTLLNTLAGRIGPGKLSGDILIDGKPRNPANWRLLCSYVEQDDVMFPNFTVYETLMFAAMLRLPSSMSRAEKMARVETVIGDLGLNGCRDTQIGTPEKKGISSGERKRVSIGIELVTDPNLIFLDEPTSGLDSFNALIVISQIRSLATKRRKLVLLTIHQPRTDILDMFDKIIVLAEGRPLWFGPPESALSHFDSLGYHIPPRTNPSDFILDIASVDYRKKAYKEQSLERIQGFWDAYERIRVREGHGVVSTLPKTPGLQEVTWRSSPSYQISILLKRNILELRRDRGVLIGALGQALFTLVFFLSIVRRVNDSEESAFNRLVIFSLLPLVQAIGFSMPYVSTFPRTRMILKRERAAGSYRSVSSFFAKFLSLIIMTTITSILISTILYWAIGLNPAIDRFGIFLLVTWLHNVNSNALSLAISACSPSIRVGQIVTPVLVFFFGYLSLYDLMKRDMEQIEYLIWISPLLYTHRALKLNEFDDPNLIFRSPVVVDPITNRMKTTTGPELLYESYRGPGLWAHIGGSVGLTCLFLLIGCVAFHRTSAPLLKMK